MSQKLRPFGSPKRARQTLESPKGAKEKTGKSKTRRMQEGFAAHLRHVARMYPAAANPRVVLLIDNAPWQTVAKSGLVERLYGKQ